MKIIKTISVLFLFILASPLVEAQNLDKTVDAILSEKYKSDRPGATALIAKDGKVIYRNAFGMANLELGVPMKPENVFEIGSITKQFTAVSILMLQEQGKLKVTDPLSKYMADYPEQGKNVSIHQLLNHTSGIKSYTGMPSFMSRAREDMTPTELIDVFKNEPMDFEPGSEYAYNNSAYIILGHIIEVVSGKSYAEFIEENIFDKLGMKNSYYGSHSKIIKNRAYGYQPIDGGYRNADYLSLTLPYAAGSIMSCVDDLLLWSQAIHNNTLISEKSKKLAFTEGKTTQGSRIYYGYGWSIDEINGTPTIEHGGGIFGYTTYGVYVPSENLYAIVLTNTNGNNPTDVTVEIASHALGKPYKSVAKTSVSEKEMKQWVGAYSFDNDVNRFITFKNGTLYSQREGSEDLPLLALGNNEFQFEGSFTKYLFAKENGKRVANFQSRIRNGKGMESELALPAEKKAISLGASTLKNYEGVYELQPGFEVTVTASGDQLFAQPTGQPKAELFPESTTTFFLKVVQAEVVFTLNSNGVAESLTLHQGGQKMPGKKKS